MARGISAKEEETLSADFPILAGFLDTLTAERLLAPSEERLVSDEAVIIDAELEESLRAARLPALNSSVH